MPAKQEAQFNVLIFTPERVVYEGPAHSLILPGEKGVFEVLPYHKRILSRLIRGRIILDNHHMAIKRGVVKAGLDQVVVIIEEDAG